MIFFKSLLYLEQLAKLIGCFFKCYSKSSTILYGDGFGFDLMKYVDELFFNPESESETSDDEDVYK